MLDVSDDINFQEIVSPEKSGLTHDIVRFVHGDGSATILGAPFANAACARIDIPLRAFIDGEYDVDLPEEAKNAALQAINTRALANR